MTFLLWEELSAAGEVSNVIEDSSMDEVSMVLKSQTVINVIIKCNVSRCLATTVVHITRKGESVIV